VVCCFIGGLGLGAYFSAPTTKLVGRVLNIKNRLRVYGAIEVIVSAAAAFTLLMAFLPVDIWGDFPYQLNNGIWVKDMTYRLGQILIAILCVSVPCFFMGVTFPLICDAFLGGDDSARFPSLLYAWNTLGACVGVLACQFLLLPLIGHSDAFALMATINLLLGLYFLKVGGAALSPFAGNADMSAPQSVKEDADVGLSSHGKTLLLSASILSGLLAGSLEGDMFKRLSFMMANNPGALMPAISFWAIVGIFLGSVAVRTLPRLTLNHIKLAYILSIICYWIAWNYGYEVMGNLEAQTLNSRKQFEITATSGAAMFPRGLSELFLYVGVYVFPAFFLNSLLLPWVCNNIQADRKHLGRAYGVNTLAFCVGMVVFTLFAPMVSIFYSLKLIFVLMICGTLLLQMMDENSHLPAWKPAVTLAAFAVGAYAVPRDFDRSYVNPGLPSANLPVSAMKSNGAVTSFVVDISSRKYLYFGNTSMSSTSATAQMYMRLMAHFPLLAQARPTKALLICFGVGNTASAIAKHDTISQIDVVDLNEKVFETAPEFSATNHNVIEDPRIRLINDDGRTYLRLTKEKYDLITSEPPPPMAAGVYRLYSREYYADAKARLTADGLMSQWLPYYQMPPDAVAKAVNTFIDVFPHTLLFTGAKEQLILLGGNKPISLSTLKERFDLIPAVEQDLKYIVVSDPIEMLVRIVQTDPELRENYREAGIISDENNALEHMFLGSERNPVISYNPKRVLEVLGREFPEIGQQLAPILTHLGRLNFRVPFFPLYGVVSNNEIKYSDLDWSQITLMHSRGTNLVSQNNQQAGLRLFHELLDVLPEHLLLRSYVGQLYLQNIQPREAEKAFRRVIEIEKDKPELYVWLAKAVVDQGRGREGIEHYRQALKLDSKHVEAMRGLARILATHPASSVRDADEALRVAERANRIEEGRNPQVLNALAAAYAANKRFEEAVATAQLAIRIARETRDKAAGEKARDEMLIYHGGRSVVDVSMID